MDETVTVLVSTAQDAPPVSIEVPRRIGHVKLGELLGQGTGGVVYSGFDEVLGRRVAVKIVQQPLRRDATADELGLIDGVRSAGNIKHPNVVTLYSVAVHDGVPIVVMEYIDGLSLRDLLKRSGRLDVSLAVFVARSVAAGVEALHAASVIHRDLKPANVLFDREGRAHVCDFGLACDIGAGRSGGPVQKIGGSPLYMAPEAFDGLISPQSDIYSLGIMLFELLVGHAPFQADSIEEMRAAHVAMDIPVIWLARRRLPEELIEITQRCLHKQRLLRFKSAGHFARALASVPGLELNEHVLAKRIADIVNAAPGDPDRAAAAREPARVETTFEVIAKRAKAKRDAKRDE